MNVITKINDVGNKLKDKISLTPELQENLKIKKDFSFTSEVNKYTKIHHSIYNNLF